MSSGDKSEDSDVICLDSSVESREDGQDTSVCEVTDKTLPPGSAPAGFILLDESVEVVQDGRDEPLFKVTFRDADIARQYKRRIREFLTDLASVETRNDNPDDLVLELWPSENPKKRKLEENGIENFNDNTLFMIDNKPGVQDTLDVPTYGKKFERVVREATQESGSEEKEKELAAPKLNCFNCLGNHNLRDCTVPRNPMEISKNRKEFTARGGSKTTRYHVDDARFEHFRPGVLSKELRKALGLTDNQLPRHIYKMRMLGYPPGWLEEARLQHSGLNLYNSEGLRESESDEEQGEIFSPESRDQYDVKKVHDFPGFNIPAPSGTVDAYWSSEQQEVHSKSAMLAMMSERKVQEGYKRKKLKRNVKPPEDSSHVQPTEMEVEPLEDKPVESLEMNGHFVPPVPEGPESTEPQPPPPPEPQSELSNDSASRTNSPSLTELEDKKKKLLEELDNSNSAYNSNPGTPTKSILNPSTCETPTDSGKIGKVTSVILGTPILQSTSPFTKLPSSDKFSKDICDVINFENLPNSTGKYEKMTGLLQKVRGTLSNSEQ